MNHKLMPAVAAFLILGVLLSASATPFAYGQAVLAFGPKLEVVTIPQDDQILKKGIMILGINPAHAPGGAGTSTTLMPTDLMSQHKLIVTYNGATFTWAVGTAGPSIACNILQKDKVNVVPDPKTGKGQQGPYENLMTALVDVSDKFVCKARWKSPATGVLESVGVLDVYYVGPLPHAAHLDSVTGAVISPAVTAADVGHYIADNILVVEAFFTVGHTVVFGSDIQDICTLGWAAALQPLTVPPAPSWIITKPDGTTHNIWTDAMMIAGFSVVSCEEMALMQKDWLGIPLPTGQDPLAP